MDSNNNAKQFDSIAKSLAPLSKENGVTMYGDLLLSQYFAFFARVIL